jgi:hypothetical protein
MDGKVVVTQVSTRMAPAPAGGHGGTDGSSRTTFAVGKITRRRREVRSIQPTRSVPWTPSDASETVH